MTAPERSPASSSTRPTARRGRSARSWRARCSRPTRRTPRTRAPPPRWPRATSRSPPNVDQPAHRRDAARLRRAGHRAPVGPEWERTTGTGSPRLDAEELDAIEAFVAAGGGLIVLGETEQEKYGNNLNELLARFGSALENDTVAGLRAPSRRAELDPGRPAAGRRGRGGDLLARVERGVPVPRDDDLGASNGAAVLARTHATRPRPRRAADRRPSSTARAASSCSPTPTCSATTASTSSTTATLWLNLFYWAARRALDAAGAAGGRAGAPSSTRPGSRCGRDQRAARCCRRPTAR